MKKYLSLINISEGSWTQHWNENVSPSRCSIKIGSKTVCTITPNEHDQNNAKLISFAPHHFITICNTYMSLLKMNTSSEVQSLRNTLRNEIALASGKSENFIINYFLDLIENEKLKMQANLF